MQGKTVIVTGATNGIGEAIAEGLAKQGAEVIIISRSEAKCAATAERISKETGNPNIRYYAADLSLQSQTRALTDTLNQDLTRLDVLVNNAGAWFTDRQVTAEGYEMTWALNHLNYFLLTLGLLDLLKQTAAQHGDARIINQASSAHLEGKMHWDDLQFERTWNSAGRGSLGAGWGVYNQSKLANVLHAFTLAHRLEGTGITANAVHPGVVVTGFAANNGLMYKLAAPVRRLFNHNTPEYGASPAVYLATTPETITGAYYGPRQNRETPNPIAEDITAQDRLWDISLEHVGMVTA